MSTVRPNIHAFNAGEVSTSALARVDQEAVRLTAERQENMMPYVVGKAIMRPGTEKIGESAVNDYSVLVPFVRSLQDTALIEIYSPEADSVHLVLNEASAAYHATHAARFYVNDAPVTIPTQTFTVQDQYFATGAGWDTSDTYGDALVVFRSEWGTATQARPYESYWGAVLCGWATGGVAVMTQTISVTPNELHVLEIVVGDYNSHTLIAQQLYYSGGAPSQTSWLPGRAGVYFSVGSMSKKDNYVNRTFLPPGVHYIAFTPTGGAATIQFDVTSAYPALIQKCGPAPAGVLTIPFHCASEFFGTHARQDVKNIQYTQSLDDIFFTLGANFHPMIIQHRGVHSWSVCYYYVDDGPFQVAQSNPDVSIWPSATWGSVALLASAPLFNAHSDSGAVSDPPATGGLLRLTHECMDTTYRLSGGFNFDVGNHTPAFRVVGVQASGDRAWSATISGTWTGEIVVERSFDNQFSGFMPYATAGTITVNGTLSVDDADDNAIIWYRLSFKTYSGGSATIRVVYGGYGFPGIVAVTSITNDRVATGFVVKQLANSTPTKLWDMGDWGRGGNFPSAVSLYDGRLWWARDDSFWGSVSDAYWSMAVQMEASTTTSGTNMVGDSSSIQRRIATGGSSDDVNFILPLQRLIFGTSGAEVSARSSSLDEPLTPTNTTLRDCSSQGSAPAMAVKIDKRGVFIQRSTHKLYVLAYNPYGQDYEADNLMRLNEDIGYPQDPYYTKGFTQLSVQRQPETYLWGVRSDGICCCLLYEPGDKVQGWVRFTTGREDVIGGIQSNDKVTNVCVLPTPDSEDRVYFLVSRTSGGTTRTFVEKLQTHYNTLTREWDNVTLTQKTAPGLYQTDCHILVTPTGIGNMELSGLGHLEGRTVIALGYSSNRQSYGPLLNTGATPYYTVTGGRITLGEPPDINVTPTITVGLPYTGYYKSSKLCYGGVGGSTALLAPKTVSHAGLLLQDTHPDALLIGSDFNGIESMDPLPRIEALQPVETKGTLVRTYDEKLFPLANVWDTDARVCVKVNPGYSATLSGLVIDVKTADSG